MQDFKNLKVWQAARRLTQSVYQLTSNFPQAEEFGLKTQIRRAAISICANIAEGSGRRGDREFRRFLDIAVGSTCELECALILAVDLGFVPIPLSEPTFVALTDMRRMLNGLLKRVVKDARLNPDP